MTSSRMPSGEDLKKMSVAEQHDWLRQQRSRRSMLKGGLAGAALLAAPVLMPTAAGAATRPRSLGRPGPRVSPTFLRNADRLPGATVFPFGRHISFGADPTSQMNITWQVGTPVRHPFVRIGTDPDNLDKVVGADIVPVVTPWADVTPVDSVPLIPPTEDEQLYVHAYLERLQEGETYFYAVGHAGFDPTTAVGSQIYSFTVPQQYPGSFRFTAFGDHGVTYDAVATSRVVGGQKPDFHLHAGDWSYAEDGGSGLLTDPFDPRVFDSWFTQIEGVAATVPWMAGVGNHEMEPWYGTFGYAGQLARFAFIGNAPSSCPVTYSFTYGNVGFISLDANDVSYELEANLGYTDGVQTTWLGAMLSAMRQEPQIDFIVVFFHQCAYSTCDVHASDGGIDQYWTPLFDQYQVDLVINGHNHIYERTDPIRAGASTGEAPIGATIRPATQGTTYVTAGSSGKSLYGFPSGVPDSYLGNVNDDDAIDTWQWEIGSSPSNPAENPITVDWSRVRYTGYALIVVDSIPGTGTHPILSVKAVMEDGVTVIDEFRLERSI
jgi:hypothetical protein